MKGLPRQTPKAIGPYRIESLIGAGAMGEVYLAVYGTTGDRAVSLRFERRTR